MNELETINYSDFEDIQFIANPDGSNSLIEIPKLTQINLIQIIDDHNKLLETVNEIIKNINKKDE